MSNFKPLGEQHATEKGFPVIVFDDDSASACHLECSTIIYDGGEEQPGTSAIWLGTDEVPMHLNKEQVHSLIGHLMMWLNTGQFE